MKKNIQQMPNGSWPVTPADKAEIVELGRKLHKTILDHANEKGELHVRILAGACQYLMDLQDQKKAALGDDIFTAQKLLNDTGLSEKIIEPFFMEEVEQKPVEGGVAAEETAAVDEAAEKPAEETVEKTEVAAEAEQAEGAVAADEAGEKPVEEEAQA